MEYNTKRGDMQYREYGRNVKKMVEFVCGLEESEKKNQAVRSLVNVMGLVSGLSIKDDATSIPNAFINRAQHIRTDGLSPFQARLVNVLLQHVAHRYDRLCSTFPLYRPFTNIMDIWQASRQVINSAADFGEGWFLPGEICDLAQHGVKKIVSLQPFGCIANHIISKGIERRYKDLFPDLSILFLDFDAGTSEANVTNRLHFLLGN